MSNSRRAFYFFYAVLAAALLSPPARGDDSWQLNYDPRYIQAVNDAQHPDVPGKTADSLTVISAANPNLVWKNNVVGSQVLMTTFTDFTGYDRNYQGAAAKAAYHPDLWMTASGELANFYKTNNVTEDQIALRTKELLGLPSGHTGNRIVEFWVKPSDIFRPTPDSDITNPHPIWVPPDQSTGDPHHDWFMNNLKTVYQPDKGNYYPWNQLGYTYDWGNTTDPKHQGLSEFICAAHSPGSDANMVAVEDVVSIGSFLYYDHAGNFFVTGECDTIWAGNQYVPTNAAGNVVDVDKGATVYEGIIVSSAGYTVNNRGTVLGPGLNLDNSYRDAVVQFDHGGLLNNDGLIDGFCIGVFANGAAGESSTIVNNGTIRGSRYSVTAGDGNLTLVNNGLLDGNVQTGNGNNAITNSGTITGNVMTGSGNDAVTLAGGLVSGAIDAGGGSNTLTVDPGAGNSVTVNGDVRNFQPFEVHSGMASFNGAVGSTVTVDPGATLGGSGNYAGNLINNGRVAPGNCIGVMSVAGNYQQGPGSTLAVEIFKPAENVLQHDSITVTGNATLAAGSTIEVDYLSGSRSVIQPNEHFVFLRTTNGFISDSGANLFCNSYFMDFYRDPNDLKSYVGNNKIFTLIASRKATFASAVSGSNAQSLASAMDGDLFLATGDYAAVISEAQFMTQPQFQQAATELSPAPYHAVSAAIDRTTQYVDESLADYLRARRSGRTCAPCSGADSHPGLGVRDLSAGPDAAACQDGPAQASALNCQTPPSGGCYSGFADPFGIFFGEKSQGDHVGFEANAVGTRVGVDRQAGEHCIVGMDTVYANTAVTFADQRGAAQINSLRLGPYFTYYVDDWYLDGIVNVGFHDNDVTRNVVVGSDTYRAGASFAASDAGAYLGAGYDWSLGEYVLSPIGSLQYTYYSGHSFTETGAGGADLTVAPQDAPSLRSRLGSRLVRTVCFDNATLTSELFAGWAHEYLLDDSLAATFAGGTTSFLTDRGGVFRDAAYYGAGLVLARGARRTLFVRYTGEMSNGGHFDACDLGLSFGY